MDVEEILKHVPIDDIAEKFGVSRDVARQAVQEGSAAIVGGLAKNAETPEGSSAIEGALNRHGGFSGASKVDDVDQADGGKILGHVFGDKKQEVTDSLTKSEKTAGGIDFGKLLPILAPIVMGLIAGAKGGSSGSGGGLGGILGGLLGGGSSTGSGTQASSGGGLGDILGGLGGLLGGGPSTGSGTQESSGGGLGDILGGLLGKR
ncbi:DUF937 domain-containing protein [Microbacterium sp. ARD32]|uniref:DUF937 domain-containing protein n=1 Tax=Microbacterium sp. ARD32 TaxID=2962577 RepID=UPI0028812CEA|nr:DUF937 domain-containing protein [Microbacterium sp. ARD32]MDT0156158.1 DUF937 domain-containing protein [Microbacterium sp. ARD32]